MSGGLVSGRAGVSWADHSRRASLREITDPSWQFLEAPCYKLYTRWWRWYWRLPGTYEELKALIDVSVNVRDRLKVSFSGEEDYSIN